MREGIARYCVPLVIASTGCAVSHVAEKRGDQLRVAGDDEGATRAYREALAQRPLMDYDYERVHRKLRAMMVSDWTSQLDAATAGHAEPTPKLLALLELRVRARTSGAPRKNVDEIDKALAGAANPMQLAAADADKAAAHLEQLIAAFGKARTLLAPKAILDGLASAIAERLRAGVPMPASQTGVDRLRWALEQRKQVRALELPGAIDTSLESLFNPLANAAVNADRTDTASAVALKQQALELGAPAVAIAYVDRMLEAAFTSALANARVVAGKHDYAKAYSDLSLAVAPLSAAHPGRAQLAAIATEAAAYYTAEAAKRPPGLVHFTYTSLAAYFGGGGRDAEAAGLSSKWDLPLQLQPAFDNPRCAPFTAKIGATGIGRATRVAVHLDTCAIDDSVTNESRAKLYTTEEVKQTGTHKEVTKKQVRDTGTHFEDCSATNGIAGKVIATCEVPNGGYITVEEATDVPDYETVKVNGSQPYTAEVHRIHALITGTTTTTWDDGTVLTTPILVDRTVGDERWSVTYPGPTAGAPSQSESHDLAPSFSVADVTSSSISDMATQIDNKMRTAIREHRAKLARAEGVAALARGDDAAAGEAFVRSVLIAGHASDDEAATWLTRTTGVQPDLIASAFGGIRIPAPGQTQWPTAIAYAGGAITATGEPETVASVADSTAIHADDELKDYLLKYGYDHGYAFLGTLPYQLQTTAGTRTAPMIGVMLGSSPLGKLTNYGPVIRDDVGVKAGIGYRFGDDLGPDEGHLVWGVDAGYWLMLGLRTHKFGIYAGGGGGYMRLSAGDSKASGFHVEPIGEIQVRAVGAYNVTFDVSGFVTLTDSLARTDRVSLLLPLTPDSGLGIFAAYESSNLKTKSTMSDGTGVDLGRQAARLFVLALGGNY